ncbi:MAG: hypothetical protein LBS78_00265 [Endomicrobium sp.]|nr:hypothetical protein [Endomicrobium sp.]
MVLSVVLGVICLIITLVQIKKTMREFEGMIKKINNVVCIINKFYCGIVSLTKKLSSPFISVASVLFHTLSKIIKN